MRDARTIHVLVAFMLLGQLTSIAAKIGCTPETLRRWVRQQERDTGQRPGPTTAEEERVKAHKQLSSQAVPA